MATSLLNRLADKFTVGDDCWEWTGRRDDKGYGLIDMPPSWAPRRAHRVIYELMVGPLPDELEPDHTCRNRGCVRPNHIDPVTHLENCHRGLVGENNRSKTHCPAGHRYDVFGSGWRGCRRCRNDAARRYRSK